MSRESHLEHSSGYALAVPVRHPSRYGNPYLAKSSQDDLCWHWCPSCKRDWTHKLRSVTIALDRWRKVCRKCRRKGGSRVA